MRSVTHWRVLAVVLVAGWSSKVAATPSVATGAPSATGSDATPPATGAHPITAWVATGLGTAGVGSQDGDAFRVEVAVAAGIHLFSFRYLYAIGTSDGCGFSGCVTNVSLPPNSASEIALQYGIKERVPYLLGSASAGVSALWPVQRGSTLLSGGCFFGSCMSRYNSIKGRTVGATAELGAYLTSQHVSVGPTFVVDVNPIQSFWTVLFDLHFGWMGDGGLFRGRQSP